MNWTASRQSQVRGSRGVRSNRARFVLESLEERTVLSSAAEMSGMAGIAEVARPLHGHHAPAIARAHQGPHQVKSPAKAHSQMTITGLTINDMGLVSTSSGDQFMANATLTGTIKGQAFSLPLAIPVTVTPVSSTATPSAATPSTGSVTTAAASTVQVLNLTLGPVNLSLLGLNVHLGSGCTIGSTSDPITVKLTAIPTGNTYDGYAGGAVGDLLSGVANLLNGGTSLSGLTSGLSSLESGLTQALNGVLSGLNSSNSAATGSTMKAAAGQHEVLDLDLNPINLDVLGALVQTSSICLNVTASHGPGNLLGNLLS